MTLANRMPFPFNTFIYTGLVKPGIQHYGFISVPYTLPWLEYRQDGDYGPYSCWHDCKYEDLPLHNLLKQQHTAVGLCCLGLAK